MHRSCVGKKFSICLAVRRALAVYDDGELCAFDRDLDQCPHREQLLQASKTALYVL